MNGCLISIVIGLPPIGPLLFTALQDQGMYLAAALIMFTSFLLTAGNLLAYVALAWAEARIGCE